MCVDSEQCNFISWRQEYRLEALKSWRRSSVSAQSRRHCSGFTELNYKSHDELPAIYHHRYDCVLCVL